ncbi:glycoside hydrolase family 9 protein [Herbivorax sp. ANBcel31]|uniref:glycoside hydrolase family 9 protein n=1 Tax=Herbivorax sp. ANBcel31 TaxID=3069754 RepID=UPI0027B6CC7A|nr:glycoside hydrolase family 9 protein [Herbivorax sp. ANBcel31]MDQ2086157.1 glycoside hydrolase family 9 protein [Herbivorax sp. ANBcel31]
MYRKKASLILVAAMIVTLLVPTAVADTEVPEEGYRQLQDYQIFKDESHVEGWSGSEYGELETVDSTLPVDYEETYNDLPSIRLNVHEPVSGWWWVSLITFRGWNTHDFTQYVENGYLEFNIKGAEGGETFIIGARDKVYSREDLEVTLYVDTSDYFDVTDEWQSVKIPLKDIMDPELGYSPLDSLCLVMEQAHTNTMTVWLNDVKITSPDNEKSYPEIKVNQLGFLNDSEKYALVTGFPEVLTADEGTEFSVIDASDDSVVYEGTLTLVSEFEAIDSGEKILKADFSDFDTSGKYYISVDAEGIDHSLEFEIGDDVFDSLLKDSSRYFYYQRQGIELVEEFAPDYPRDDMTPQDSEAIFMSDDKDAIDVTKGWYDAGDYGKYVNAGATAVSDLFWAYEMFPSQFNDNQFNIPESGNEVPDILDEARWQLEWMLKMQDEETGGFYPRVQSDDDENITMRIIRDQNGPTTDDTACAAAILAHAYILYNDIDKEFADECYKAAERAWLFLEDNPDNIISPPGPYNVDDDSGNRLWAAASLYRASGKAVYHEYFLDNYQKFSDKFQDEHGYAHTWGDMWLTAYLMYLSSYGVDSDAEDWINTELDLWIDKMLERYEENPWNNAIIPGNYFWGINMQVLNVPMDAIIASAFRGTYDEDITNFGFGSLNWILGANPLRLSFVSGQGQDSINQIFSNIYNHDGKSGIPNGYLAGGPNAYEGSGLSRFAAKSYTRSAGDWVTNEHTVYWNSPLVFMAAYANEKAAGGNIEPPTVEEPDPEPTPEPSFVYGDLDGDGEVSSTDYALLSRHVLHQQVITDSDVLKAADVNGDGVIDSTDAALIKRYVLDIIDTFPAEE